MQQTLHRATIGMAADDDVLDFQGRNGVFDGGGHPTSDFTVTGDDIARVATNKELARFRLRNQRRVDAAAVGGAHVPRDQRAPRRRVDRLPGYQPVPADPADPPAGGELEAVGKNFTIDPSGEFKSEKEIGQVAIARTEQGAPVYLRDVVDVERGYDSPPRFLNFFDCRDAQDNWRRSRAIRATPNTSRKTIS